MKTKISVYKAVVLSTLLCGCESWTLYRKHLKDLDQFHLCCLLKILHTKWKDKVFSQDVLHRAKVPGIVALVTEA